MKSTPGVYFINIFASYYDHWGPMPIFTPQKASLKLGIGREPREGVIITPSFGVNGLV